MCFLTLIGNKNKKPNEIMIKFIKNVFFSIAFFFKLIFKLFKFVLMLTGIMSFPRCGNSGYTKEGDKNFYNGKEIGKNFTVLNDVFAKDDTAAYFKSYSIANADIATFIALDKHYAKDKNTVYYCDEEREGQNYYLTKHSVIIPIKQADPASFISLGNGYTRYAKDNKWGYFQGNGFPVKDVATVEISENGDFLKDKYQVYVNRKPIEGSDVQSFRLLKINFAQDTNHAYYLGNGYDEGVSTIPCNIRSFTLLEYPFSKDDVAVFNRHKKMPDADPQTFVVLDSDYSKDKQNVFFNLTKIKGADAATFVPMPEEETALDRVSFAKDTNHVYMNDKPFGAEASSFKALGHGYSLDRKHVYYITNILKGADPSSFKVYPHTFGDANAEDNNSKYGEGKKVAQ
jgi:DKNYY family